MKEKSVKLQTKKPSIKTTEDQISQVLQYSSYNEKLDSPSRLLFIKIHKAVTLAIRISC